MRHFRIGPGYDSKEHPNGRDEDQYGEAMTKVLISGATGFIGLHLRRRLCRKVTTSPVWCGRPQR